MTFHKRSIIVAGNPARAPRGFESTCERLTLTPSSAALGRPL